MMEAFLMPKKKKIVYDPIKTKKYLKRKRYRNNKRAKQHWFYVDTQGNVYTSREAAFIK